MNEKVLKNIKIKPLFLILALLNSGCVFNNINDESYIPYWEDTALINQILIEYKGNILSPEHIGSLAPLNKPVGWEFKISKSHIKPYDFFYRYEGKEGDEYHFILKNLKKSQKIKWVNGIRYYLKTKNGIAKYETNGIEFCKFVIGECNYKSYSGFPKTQYSKFSNGVWVRKVQNYKGDWSLRKEIYDASGLPLLYSYKSLKTGKSYEKRRYERFEEAHKKTMQE